MVDNNTVTSSDAEQDEQQGSLSFSKIWRMVILNWQWFVISLFGCLFIAFLYMRYTDPTYEIAAKVYVKDDQGQSSRYRSGAYAALQDMSNLGLTSYGIDNELEIMMSSGIAEQAVRNLKLYTSYWRTGRIHDAIYYRDQPFNVDLDPTGLEKLNTPIKLKIKYEDGKYHITGTYCVPVDEIYYEGPYLLDKTFASFPATIKTGAGYITITENTNLAKDTLDDGGSMKAVIVSPRTMAYAYCGKLTVELTSKTSTVMILTLPDKNIRRGRDYLSELVRCYNQQANDDKNEISLRTEEFINDRLSKISAELGSTEGDLESYKRSNRLVTLSVSTKTSVEGAADYEQRLTDANTQISLINSLIEEVNTMSQADYGVLPANIGINDNTTINLISTYNNIVLERNKLLRTASADNPAVTPLTAQLDDLKKSIRQALAQAKRTAETQRQAIAQQLGVYSSEISKSPEQERVLAQIGRQQETKAGLYLTLLQKREENSINLAATSDKGKVIESPQYTGSRSPKKLIILALAIVFGLGLPVGILWLLDFFKFRIEDHDDVTKLTTLPILADIAVANETTKMRGDIVVHENKNNTMEEVFRSLRTNLQFMLKGDEKTIMFTSSLSGEGKTFCAANLAISFALLGKRVVIVGLDIRKPRLAELFEIHNHHNGITNLLAADDFTWDDVNDEILPSEVNNNLDLLMAGPVPPNPAELICRQNLDKVIDMLHDHYDYIIIDTAPAGLVSDTLQIGRVANITVYVCRADYTPKRFFEQLNTYAAEKRLPNIGIVVNGIDMSKKKHRYNYGYGYYGRMGAYYGKYYYGSYGHYYSNSRYADKSDNSVKRRKHRHHRSDSDSSNS